MSRYRLLIFDIDDTLVDFLASQHAALADVHARDFSAVPLAAFRAAYTAINDALWLALNRREVTTDDIRALRFVRTAQQLGLPEPDWRATGEFYEAALARHTTLFPGVLETLAALAPHFRLAAITNGLARVQRPKAARTGLDRWLDPYVISEEEGVAKPDPEVFRRCLARVGCAAHEALMIGDSWSSDGAGAANAGIDFCWFRHDPTTTRPASLPPPVCTIERVAALPPLLLK